MVSFTLLRSVRRRKRNAHERVPVGCTTKCRPGHAASGHSARTASPAPSRLGLAAATKRVVSTVIRVIVGVLPRGVAGWTKQQKRACAALLHHTLSNSATKRSKLNNDAGFCGANGRK